MPASRLPFALEDLCIEIGKVGGNAHITIMIPDPAFEAVIGVLRSQATGTILAPLDGYKFGYAYGGISIIKQWPDDESFA